MRKEQKVLIISGMHRSGTSLVAHYLQLCGLHIGETLIEPDIGNPLGYYEDQEFLSFHRRILEREHLDAFAIDESNLQSLVKSADREKAQELVDRRSKYKQWGWKECRTSLFLDFWDRVIENATYLFLFRHPIAVTDSLVRRGTDEHIVRKPVIGLRAWRIYNREIERFAADRQERAIICEIEDVIRAPTAFCGRIVELYGLELEPVPFDSVFVKGALRKGFSKSVSRLKLLHFAEFVRCMFLYNRLRKMKAIF